MLCALILGVGAWGLRGWARQALRQRLITEIHEISILWPADLVEADRRLETVLSNPDYERVGHDELVRLGVRHRRIHEAALLEGEARREVRPFLAKIAALRKSKDFDGRRVQIYGETMLLLDRYEDTSLRPQLEALGSELQHQILYGR